MKRMLTGVLWCVLSVPCVHAMDPWAELKGSVAVREADSTGLLGRGSSSGDSDTQNVTLLPKILQGQPVKVNVVLPSSDSSYGFATEKVRAGYRRWFYGAAEVIERQHREQEFQDVLPTLKQGVSLEFNKVSASGTAAPADMTVIFKENLQEVRKACGCTDCLGCRIKGTNGSPMKVIVDESQTTLEHELGHTLGLADTYEEGYKKNASQTHRSNERNLNAGMGGSLFSLTEDDADGLINVMDSWKIHEAKKQHPLTWRKYVSPRITKGWNGLDRNEKTGSSKDHYREGSSVKVQTFNKARTLNNSKVF